MNASSPSWFRRYYAPLLLVIIAFSFVTRVWQLHVPNSYMFDEVYHALTAKLMARNDNRAFEWWNPPVEEHTAVDWLHPPLAKYTQALGIRFFGENSFGWRISSAVFGTLVIFLTARLALVATADERVSLLAAFLAASDGLLLVQSRIAMNDIHVTFAILLTLLMYSKFNKELGRGQNKTDSLLFLFATGVSAGIAIATKWSGLFALIIVWIFEILSVSAKISPKLKWRSWFLSRFIFLLAVPVLIYVASYGQMYLQGKDLVHFKELHKNIFWYQTNLVAEHPYESRPWQWALNLKPVWYHVQYQEKVRADIYAFGNLPLFWIGLVAVGATSLHLLRQFLHQAQEKKYTLMGVLRAFRATTLTPTGFLVFSYFAVWLPWQFSPRIMFFYHYAPAVPLLAIILSWWLVLQERYRTLVWLVIGLIAMGFVLWYPHWTGIFMSQNLKDSLYFFYSGWK
ncbi:phospholipid carrier-dependent glycosyltransferase [Candidatus Woesebacteria bacterium]|nr:phospholipid carrier-dependent glycosyltransferase [Candidatus Woesebacteria bacterium]